MLWGCKQGCHHGVTQLACVCIGTIKKCQINYQQFLNKILMGFLLPDKPY